MDIKNIIAKALSNICVLLKLLSTSLILLWALYSFLLTSSPRSLSKTSFRVSSLLLFPILLRMDSKALLKHPPVSLPHSFSYFHPLYIAASIPPVSHTRSNFAHAVPWQLGLCYLISCQFLHEQHLLQEILTNHSHLKQEPL